MVASSQIQGCFLHRTFAYRVAQNVCWLSEGEDLTVYTANFMPSNDLGTLWTYTPKQFQKASIINIPILQMDNGAGRGNATCPRSYGWQVVDLECYRGQFDWSRVCDPEHDTYSHSWMSISTSKKWPWGFYSGGVRESYSGWGNYSWKVSWLLQTCSATSPAEFQEHLVLNGFLFYCSLACSMWFGTF